MAVTDASKPPRVHDWAPFRDDEGDTWQKCKHCAIARQSFDEFVQTLGRPFAGPKAKNWRLWVVGVIFWADDVPACRRGAWKTELLEAGDIPEQLKEGELVFVCAGVCEGGGGDDGRGFCDCPNYHGKTAGSLQRELMAFTPAAVAPVHEGCTCYVTPATT